MEWCVLHKNALNYTKNIRKEESQEHTSTADLYCWTTELEECNPT
jgi:hypothetical protein